MRTDADRTLDVWSPLAHRPVLSRENGGFLVPSWVGDHGRRLSAYKILGAYYRNAQRNFMDAATPELQAAMRQYREFGDPKTFRDAIVSALLGAETPIPVVDDADLEPSEDDPDKAAKQARAKAAKQRQDELRAWDTTERAGRKLFEGERHAVGLGDAVWAFHVDYDAGRVSVTVHDPAFYFPVLSTAGDSGFPRKVHLAWEFEETDETNGRTRRFVRRQTWEQVRIGPDDDNVRVETVTTPAGSFVRWLRDYPYNLDDSGAVVGSPWKVLYSDGTWPLEELDGREVSVFTERAVVWATNPAGDELHNVDLGIDFIPVVHEPNTPADDEHYGEASLANVAQVQDEIALNDTDTSRAAATTGVPIIAASGISVDRIAVTPGTVINLGPTGQLSVVSTAEGLKALMDRGKELLDRRDANGRVPSALLGRVDPSAIDAGVILALSFGPLRALIGEMRLVRDEVYPLFWKFQQRLSIAAGFYDDATVYPATFSTSSFLPSDEAALVTMLVAMVNAKILSRETAVRLLQAEGFDIESVSDELQRIAALDFEGADLLFAATSSEELVAKYLGLDPQVIADAIAARDAAAQAALDAAQGAGNGGGQPPQPPTSTG